MSFKRALEDMWTVLSDYRENCIPEGDENYDEQWDDICHNMEVITNAAGSSAMLEELRNTWDVEERGCEHSHYAKADWQQDVCNDGTVLGYWEWVLHNLEANGESVHDFL